MKGIGDCFGQSLCVQMASPRVLPVYPSFYLIVLILVKFTSWQAARLVLIGIVLPEYCES
jgi:hypothetical protein